MVEGIPPPPGAEYGVYATPAGWVDWFLALSREQQEIVATERVEAEQRAEACYLRNHEQQIERLQGTLSRLLDMMEAWEQRLPEMINRDTAVDAVRTTIRTHR